jgi:hypothetical protein
MENLQSGRAPHRFAGNRRAQTDKPAREERAPGKLTRLMAVAAFSAAALLAIPGGWQRLAEIPLTSWLLVLVGSALLWRSNSHE